MKTSSYTEAQIISILRQGAGGVPVAERCREYDVVFPPAWIVANPYVPAVPDTRIMPAPTI